MDLDFFEWRLRDCFKRAMEKGMDPTLRYNFDDMINFLVYHQRRINPSIRLELYTLLHSFFDVPVTAGEIRYLFDRWMEIIQQVYTRCWDIHCPRCERARRHASWVTKGRRVGVFRCR